MDLAGDVIEEIAQKYKNVQEGIGGMMRGALIETSARRLKNEANREMAIKLLKRGKMTVEEIAEDTGLRIEDVEQFARFQSV